MTTAKLKRAALGLLAAVTAGLLATVPARAEPALWVVRDADSTIYLFGTIHVLKPTAAWRTPKIDAAFASSRELWLETSEGDDPKAVQALVTQLGVDPKTTLSSRLEPADQARLAAAATAAGLPGAALETMRPWLAALTLTIAPIIKAGYDPAKGVDKVLEAAAKSDGKAIRTFETMEQQFRFFADLPPTLELDMLKQTLEESAEGTQTVDAMAAAWAEGDLGTLDRLIVSDMRKGYPEVYDVLLRKRNIAWADAIRTVLAGSGTHFIAVGAGHLIGPDSVQAQLNAKGVAVSRH